MLPAAVAQASCNSNAICHVLPVLWMTSRFYIMEAIGRIKDNAYVSSSSLGSGTGGEACRLRLYLFYLHWNYRIQPTDWPGHS